jgi:mono/diheme cytochrome c family protein
LISKAEGIMKVSITRWLVFAGVLFAVTFLMASVPARTSTQDDTAALYKSKCFACHGATAEKKFDGTKAEADLIQTVLKGRKMEKPPNMPAYEEKGVTPDQSKALVGYMKSLKP